MLNIPSAALPVVAEESRNILAATDLALLANANLMVAVIEASQGADAPLGVTQDVFARIVSHSGKLVEGREEMRRLITRFTAIKASSNQKEVALGCPAGAPKKIDGDDGGVEEFFTGARLKGAGQLT